MDYSRTNTELVFTLLRVFVDHGDASAFKNVFRLAFATIEEVIQQPITFQHIHNSGFESMVSNMGQDQLRGKYCYHLANLRLLTRVIQVWDSIYPALTLKIAL